MGDRGSVPVGAVMVALGVLSAIAFGMVHLDGTASWWAAVAWVSGLVALIGGLANVGTRWVGDPWRLSQILGALGAGLAVATGVAAFVVLGFENTGLGA